MDDGEDDVDVDGSRAATGGASEHGRSFRLPRTAESSPVRRPPAGAAPASAAPVGRAPPTPASRRKFRADEEEEEEEEEEEGDYGVDDVALDMEEGSEEGRGHLHR